MMRFSLLSGRARRQPPAGRSPRARSDRQRTLGLASVLRRPDTRGFHILDLGPANPQNLNFFTGLDVKVSIGDFYRGLSTVRAQTGAGEAAPFGSLFPYRREQRFGHAGKQLIDNAAMAKLDGHHFPAGDDIQDFALELPFQHVGAIGGDNGVGGIA